MTRNAYLSRWVCAVLPAALGLSLSPSPSLAQDVSAVTVPTLNGAPVTATDTGPTLADTLVKARPPHDGVVLTVNGDKVMRLPDAVLPGVQPAVSEVADAYGRITQTFGGVTAVAPPKMTVLNTDTTPVNPYDGIPPNDAFKLLCGNLDDAQWGLLTGPSGLGDGDLTDAQRPLFEALFVGSGLSYRFIPPMQFDGTTYTMDLKATMDTPWISIGDDDLPKLRLRLTQRLQISVPTGKDRSVWISTSGLDPGNKSLQAVVSLGGVQNKTTLLGVTSRAVVPNAPKQSDLDFRNPVFAVSINLDGVKTVGDLVARIGVATHLELYADRRYEKRVITTLGAASATAGDLLRALALCVRGAYRQVGTACVLTNDQVGLAPRRLAADRLAAEAAAKRQEAEEAESDRLITQRGAVLGLPGANGEEITTQEIAFTPPDRPKSALFPENPSVSVPWSLLTPPQRDMAEIQFKAVNTRSSDPRRSPDWIAEGKQNGLFNLSADVTLQLLSPGFPAPLELPNSFTEGLFKPSPALEKELHEKNQQIDSQFDKATNLSVSVPTLAARLASLPRRAVFARPRTGAELDALIGAMKRLGLNQLWLDVFSQGKVHMDGSHDLLTEALAKTKGTSITVIPAIELLDWGLDAPADTRDINIFGETPPLSDGGLPVSPALTSAQDKLTVLVQRLATTPGVSAIVIHDTVSLEQKPEPNTVPTYAIGPRGPIFGSQNAVTGQDFWSHDLGYVTPLRLGFLRRWHLDPIDLPKVPDASLKVDVSVPDFDNPYALSGMDQAWNDWRIAAKVDLMQRLLAAAQASAGRRFPFLIRQPIDGYSGDGYGLWDDPHTWLPLLRPHQHQAADDDNLPPPRPMARLKLYEPKPSEIETREAIAGEIHILGSGWDGLVLDCGDSPGGKTFIDLAPALKHSSPKIAGH